MALHEVFVYDALRTPRTRGKPTGGLHVLTPVSLVTALLKELRKRYRGIESKVDEVILGCCEQLNDQGGNLARSGALAAGFPNHVPGLMVSRFCGSALDAVNTGAAKVMAGQADLLVVGGVEMLSLFTIFGSGGPMVLDPEFKDQVPPVPQGIAADLIATLQGYSRRDVDSFAAASQQRADTAWKNGWFSRSIVPVETSEGIVTRDELVRENVTVDSCNKLRPSFAKLGAEGYEDLVRLRYPQVSRVNYVHHAGNSSGIADGAGIVLLGSREGGQTFNLKPRARTLSGGRARHRLELKCSDIDLYEVNEAFASVVLYFMEKTKVAHEKVTVAGGSIAMGHPVGATGAMLLGTLVDELQRRQLQRGAVTMCTGLGMGVATILETGP